jgi:ATP-binding cassette subfamily B (MDR/TAP) protein 7
MLGLFSPHSTLPIYPLSARHPKTDGAARIGATLSGELLNAVFANIGQRAIRKVARETFEHLLNLDLKFHLSRQTGGLTRAIDRGTKGITFLLQAIIFRIAPTALEITMVCGILVGLLHVFISNRL